MPSFGGQDKMILSLMVETEDHASEVLRRTGEEMRRVLEIGVGMTIGAGR